MKLESEESCRLDMSCFSSLRLLKGELRSNYNHWGAMLRCHSVQSKKTTHVFHSVESNQQRHVIVALLWKWNFNNLHTVAVNFHTTPAVLLLYSSQHTTESWRLLQQGGNQSKILLTGFKMQPVMCAVSTRVVWCAIHLFNYCFFNPKVRWMRCSHLSLSDTTM